MRPNDMVTLRGITWDHARGFDPMVATAQEYARRNPEVEIQWEKRPLQAFADRPIGEMAAAFDLMVIDHPHVGEAAKRGELLALNTVGRSAALDDLAANSVGPSHRSYEFGGQQWALAIDAATPVAAYRGDQLRVAPESWDDVLTLARTGKVAFALVPINALMTFMGLARNMGFDLAEDPEMLIPAPEGGRVLQMMKEIVGLMDDRCLSLDPIGILDWMGRSADAPVYSPFGYGYSNYSRDGYCRFPLTFTDAPGVADNGPRGTVIGGTGIAVSANSEHREIATDYAFWIAGGECQAGLFFDAGGQPGHASAWNSDHCNAASRNFFRNSRKTLETSWLRPRYDGYMGFQDRGGQIVHAYLRSELSAPTALEQLQSAYVDGRS